jgi:hypothetical protein
MEEAPEGASGALRIPRPKANGGDSFLVAELFFDLFTQSIDLLSLFAHEALLFS